VKPSDATTVKAKRSPIILVVGFGAAFVRRCNEAAAESHATVVGVEAGAESAFAMQALPYAVVIQKSAVPTSPLASIARELGIELIELVDDTVGDARLKELFAAALSAAQKRARPITR
jgi:hypothetical protein